MSININFVLADGSRRSIDVEPGKSVMNAAVEHGVPGIVGECTGEMSCATCHVYVDPGIPFRSMSNDEDDLLEAVDSRTEQSRLSCQLILRPEIAAVDVVVPQ